ncbi:MAG: class I SAM-dependent rRNA methyltransferase [Spirochaetales bacterium]|jgi:23S rRNA (cytosine1962-C5)-methyltransferase|nr:class I SAM-dependent rRNA methyltransferase [Spirochaetales bacterium]
MKKNILEKGTVRIILKTGHPGRYPWIFSRMVMHPRRRPEPGALVEVWAKGGVFVGRGIYHPDRTLAIRLLTKNPDEPLNGEFIYRRLEAAKDLRENILRIPEQSDSYRLIHAEADGLSGLVVDKFADVFVAQPFSAGYLSLGPLVAEALQRLYPGCRVAFRPDEKTEKTEGVSFAPLSSRYPAPDCVDIQENGLRLRVDLAEGHKTGYFLDQRDNRAAAAAFAAGKKVWDLFCYTGGFGLAAARAGAAEVISVDLDEKALRFAEDNAKRNSLPVKYIHRDCFDFLRGQIAGGEQADIIIADPAKLAAVKEEIPRALKTYSDINRLAIEALRPGGILVSCSCSGLVSEEQFLSVLGGAAKEAKREMQIFRIAGAAPDHPWSTDFPEGRYLKAVFARCIG